MWAYFAGHVDPILLSFSQHLHTVCCRAVAQMKLYSCLFRKQNISCHDHIFNRISNAFESQFFSPGIGVHHTTFYHCNIFTVSKYDHSCFFCCPHSPAIQGRIHYRLAILADAHTAFSCHAFDICQIFTHLSDRYRAKL